MNLAKHYITNQLPVALTALIWVTSFWSFYNNYVIWIFGAYAIYTGWHQVSKFHWNETILVLPVLLFVAYAVGIFWSDDLFKGYKQVEKRMFLLVFPIMFIFLKNKFTRVDITRILHTFLFFCVGISIVCYVYASWQAIHYGSLKVVGELERNYYYFSYKYLTYPVGLDPIYVSLYANFAIIILLFRPLRNTVISFLLIVYFLFFIVLVASKAGIIGTFMILSLYFLGRIKNKFIAIGICVITLGSLIWAVKSSKFLRERFMVSTQFNYELPWAGDWNSTSQRLAIWTCAIETIEKVFPWGYGTADGQQALNATYKSKNYIRGYEDEYNAHSEYLHTLLETGIFGFIALLLIFGLPFIRSVKNRDPLFAHFLILIFFYFFVETVLYRRDGGLFFSFFYCLLALNGLIEQRKAQTTISNEI